MEVIAAVGRCSGGDGSAVKGEGLLVEPARRRSMPMGRAARANRNPLMNHRFFQGLSGEPAE